MSEKSIRYATLPPEVQSYIQARVDKKISMSPPFVEVDQEDLERLVSYYANWVTYQASIDDFTRYQLLKCSDLYCIYREQKAPYTQISLNGVLMIAPEHIMLHALLQT
jgi:hypothetical protein